LWTGKPKWILFEQLRWEHEFGIGTIAGVAAKFGVHRRVVRRREGQSRFLAAFGRSHRGPVGMNKLAPPRLVPRLIAGEGLVASP
jgi:hypothetical protein